MESILPTHLWTIRVSHCGKRDMAEGTGVLVYRLANGWYSSSTSLLKAGFP
jgi:hypothetical protein